MELIHVTKENIEKEHICCAISNNKDCQVMSKKNWLSDRFDDGLVFTKGDMRGKCFIEYIPAEKAWVPILADGYMYIDCLWVSGQWKGKGYSSKLLESCINDSKNKGKAGLVVLSSKKKKAYLSDPEFLKYKGFKECDAIGSDFLLFYLPFSDDAGKPKFKEQVKKQQIEEKGIVIYYADQCPFTAKYVPLLKKVAEEKGVLIQLIHLETAMQAQEAPTPFTSFSLFFDGKFVTHEIQSEKKFEKFLSEKL